LFVNEDLRTFSLALSEPQVSSGDEPHYLVALHSVLEDGDLDLSNNYASVHRGSDQAGAHLAGTALAHHVTWYVGGERVYWWQIYELDDDRWHRDAEGAPVPTVRPEVAARDVPKGPEHPFHPAGLPLLLAALLLPLRGSSWIEPAALCVSGAVTIGALLAFRALARSFAPERTVATWTACLAFLGTPLWHYGRSLFTEPYLACFAVASYALALCRGRFVAAGVALALGTSMKPPFAILAAPLLVVAARERGARGVGAIAGPLIAATLLVLGLNDRLYGSPWNGPQPFEYGSVLLGGVGLLASPLHGLLPIAPLSAIALAGWPALWRRSAARAWAPAAGFALYFFVMASWLDWRGGFCFGPRLIVPVVPFLCLGLVGVGESAWWRRPLLRRGAIALGALSVLMNGWAALHHIAAFDAHPLLDVLRAYHLSGGS
jgi:hypothetical protein